MTPDQRFTLIIFMLGLIAALVGFFGRRLIKKTDERWARLDALWASEQTDQLQSANGLERFQRIEAAIAQLLEIVTQQGLQASRHEGYHEARDKPVPPLLG